MQPLVQFSLNVFVQWLVTSILCTLPEVSGPLKHHLATHVLWYQLLWVPLLLCVVAFIFGRQHWSAHIQYLLACSAWVLLSTQLCVLESAITPYTIAQTVYTIAFMMLLQLAAHSILDPASGQIVSGLNLSAAAAAVALFWTLWTVEDWTAAATIAVVSLTFSSYVNWYSYTATMDDVHEHTMELYFSVLCHAAQGLWQRKTRKEKKVSDLENSVVPVQM